MSWLLGELAQRAGAKLRGDASCEITGVATLQNAGRGSIAFLSNPRYAKYLRGTNASAVIIAPERLPDCPVSALVTDNPYLVYARIAKLLFPDQAFDGGVHPSAILAGGAGVHPSAWIGAGSIIEEGVIIGARVFIGPACIVGKGCTIGNDSRLVSRVTLCSDTVVGERALLHPGSVIGSDGFGLANEDGRWLKVPQLGRVRLGDDVEIGANTTIDRGALEDTVIADGVKLDNQIQVAHNVKIGAHTAIAACSGIAGSSEIGRHCTLAGGVGIAGHLKIGDNVHFSGQSLVTRSFSEPGYYSGNIPAVANRDWKRAVARVRHLDDLAERVKQIEMRLAQENDP